MRSWASRVWDAYWDRRTWRDRDRVATVIAYAVFIPAAVAIGWFWPFGTVGSVTSWATLFVFLGLCLWYGKRRARRQAAR